MRRLVLFVVPVLFAALPSAGSARSADVAAENPLNERLASVLSMTDGRAAVVAVRGGRVVAAAGRDADAYTALHLASVSKTVTAVAVMRLAERGDIRLDEPIGRYLGGVFSDGNPDVVARPVSAFLNHATGLRSNNLRAVTSGATSWKQYADQVVSRAPASSAGSYLYSNDNYVMLSALIEAVTKKPFNVAIEQLIWSPLGVPGGWLDVTTWATQVLGGAGAWVASPFAVARLFEAINPRSGGRKLLSAAWMSRLHDVAYSGGYRNGVRYRNGAWGHTGSLRSVRSAAVVARSGTVYVVLSQGAKPTSSERLFDALARLG